MKCVAVFLGAFCLSSSFIFTLVAQESFIELYEHQNYGGEKVVLYETNGYLEQFNDKVSSFKVRKSSEFIFMYCVWLTFVTFCCDSHVKKLFGIVLSIESNHWQ